MLDAGGLSPREQADVWLRCMIGAAANAGCWDGESAAGMADKMLAEYVKRCHVDERVGGADFWFGLPDAPLT